MINAAFRSGASRLKGEFEWRRGKSSQIKMINMKRVDNNDKRLLGAVVQQKIHEQIF